LVDINTLKHRESKLHPLSIYFTYTYITETRALGRKTIQSTQVYIHIERSLFLNAPSDDYHVKVAKTQEEITQLLETGFEYVLQKDDLAFFRKRK
jgi:hypothetical protein